MSEKLKITKLDGTIHYVETSQKPFFEQHNRLMGAGKQWTLEVVKEDSIDPKVWKSTDAVKANADATKELLEESKKKDDLIAELQAKLEAAASDKKAEKAAATDKKAEKAAATEKK